MDSFSNNRCYFLYDAKGIHKIIKNLPIKLDSVRLPICYGYATVDSLELRLVNWWGRGTRCCGKLKPIIHIDGWSGRRKDSWTRHSFRVLCHWQRDSAWTTHQYKRTKSTVKLATVSQQQIATLLCSKLATCSCQLLSWLTIRYVPAKRRDLYKLHGVTTQKTVHFIGTAVTSSNPTIYEKIQY